MNSRTFDDDRTMVFGREERPIIIVSENAQRTLEKRYFARDTEGNVNETIEDMFFRVARKVAEAELKYNEELYNSSMIEFYDIMANFYFLPNSPVFRHFGITEGCGSACFVLPIEDSRESIFGTLGDAAHVQSAGGGTGYSFGKLRPRGSRVGKYGATSSGPVSFMGVYNVGIGDIIRQGGVRDGAQMGVMPVNHPDIMEFINCKKTESHLSNFNISVAITDEFMETLNDDKLFPLTWIGKIGGSQQTIITHSIKAKEIWDAIVDGAWKNGEPGVIFIDTANRENPLRDIETIEATNPCGEQPLPPYGVCNLGSINLSAMVKDKTIDQVVYNIDIEDYAYKDAIKAFNWSLFDKTIRTSIRFLDNVIDVNNFPLEKLEEYSLRTRRIGLGIMGLADAMIKLGIKYSSNDAIKFCNDVAAFMKGVAYSESEILAKERGIPEACIEAGINRRNAGVLSIAPTGTLSIIANCSSGVEPNFDSEYEKMAIGGKLKVVSPLFKSFISQNAELPSHFETAKDISAKQQLEIVAVWQKYVDSGISKTVNVQNDFKKDGVDEIFRSAWRKGCKCMCFYRDGTRRIQAISGVSGISGSSSVGGKEDGKEDGKRHRGEKVWGLTQRVKTGLGTAYITMNHIAGFDNDLIEVFANIGKAGTEESCMTEAIGRLISLCCKRNIPLIDVVKQLRGIGGEKPLLTKDGLVRSIPDAIAKTMEENFLGTAIEGEPVLGSNLVGMARMKCPDCGEPVLPQEGCLTCNYCGYTECG